MFRSQTEGLKYYVNNDMGTFDAIKYDSRAVDASIKTTKTTKGISGRLDPAGLIGSGRVSSHRSSLPMGRQGEPGKGYFK